MSDLQTIHEKSPVFYEKYERKAELQHQTHYCPGCGHGVAHKLIAETTVDMTFERRRPPLEMTPASQALARHAQRISAAGRDRHPGVVGHAEADDLAGADQLRRLQHLRRRHQISVAALIVGAPARFEPVCAKDGAGDRLHGCLVH